MMPNIIAYNTRMVKRSEVPVSDEDLLNPKWRGKIGMDHTKPEWFSWKLKRLGQDKGLAYMKRLGTQEFKLYSGPTIITGLLAAGEFPLVLNPYIHNAEDAKRKGAPVDWLAQDPVFTKFQPIGVAAKAPHRTRRNSSSTSCCPKKDNESSHFLAGYRRAEPCRPPCRVWKN